MGINLSSFLRFKFKALELNRKILEGAVAPKKPAPKEATRPEGFQLEVGKRLQERHANKKSEEHEDHTFHSRPLPTRILEEVVVRNSYSFISSMTLVFCSMVAFDKSFDFCATYSSHTEGVPEKKVLNPTVPESPAFAIKNRVRVERKTEAV